MRIGRANRKSAKRGKWSRVNGGIAYHLGGVPLVLPVLHGASGPWDEVVIFGGIGSILIGLAFVSWRNGQRRKRRRGRRRSHR